MEEGLQCTEQTDCCVHEPSLIPLITRYDCITSHSIIMLSFTLSLHKLQQREKQFSLLPKTRTCNCQPTKQEQYVNILFLTLTYQTEEIKIDFFQWVYLHFADIQIRQDINCSVSRLWNLNSCISAQIYRCIKSKLTDL